MIYAKRQAGFSLVELLIAMVISLTLIFACASVYSSLRDSIKASQDLSTAQESLRTAHYLMSRSVRQGYGLALSGANGTDRELIVTYGSEADNNIFYGCLGERQYSGAKDTFKIVDDNLYCHTVGKASAGAATLVSVEELVALDVTNISASLATGNKKGVYIALAIKGMPGDMATNGFKFSLAMRQRILIDAGVSNASNTSL
ncbi:prepilin-type N-terminal cleavage/methylation domain-containing protein [Psychromonas sp. psych-6C06]|uniref:PilW family protein n=1 Tax=Psychromonas sp. psych-6C06 TaxID=2058089 RepID=UPI00187C6678|nr:prepilin-type N-terminal cleavage/methylation domain-containing protein [Psychromonas sp. psych-6C06]